MSPRDREPIYPGEIPRPLHRAPAILSYETFPRFSRLQLITIIYAFNLLAAVLLIGVDIGFRIIRLACEDFFFAPRFVRHLIFGYFDDEVKFLLYFFLFSFISNYIRNSKLDCTDRCLQRFEMYEVLYCYGLKKKKEEKKRKNLDVSITVSRNLCISRKFEQRDSKTRIKQDGR